ncbi:mating type protein MAT1-1 [Marssonina coronariae]|uniref:MAT1-1-5 n=1 Tax=Diplocarpon coronariae TaxID=2795749 RepID=A0A218YWF3_9HELO|nr:mating type protein MAT1-1 [Marssonina coronariae]QRL06101.1 MAT1-1-5 [Marssonina coronariae]
MSLQANLNPPLQVLEISRWFEILDLEVEAVTEEDIRAIEAAITIPGNVIHPEKKIESPSKHQQYSQQFITKVIRSLIRYIYYSHCLLLKSAGIVHRKFPSAILNDISIKKGLRTIMDVCCQLRDAPQNFPPGPLRGKFLSTVAILANAMVSMEETRLQMFRLKQQVFSPITDMQQPLSDRTRSIPIEYPMPPFLPDKLNGKNPWNNWLDNSAYPTAGWTAIQQKIPKAGEKLMRQIVLLYEAVEEDLDQDTQSSFNSEQTSGIPKPGDAFKHMTWSGFCTFPSYNIGFHSGKRKQYDAEGITTLEHLSKALCRHYGGDSMILGSENCPFFRFAMAYTKR